METHKINNSWEVHQVAKSRAWMPTYPHKMSCLYLKRFLHAKDDRTTSNPMIGVTDKYWEHCYCSLYVRANTCVQELTRGDRLNSNGTNLWVAADVLRVREIPSTLMYY